eukprot:2311714-Pyramimonas_sp.AAC.1
MSRSSTSARASSRAAGGAAFSTRWAPPASSATWSSSSNSRAKGCTAPAPMTSGRRWRRRPTSRTLKG